MALMRWTPWTARPMPQRGESLFTALQRDMNRLFEDFVEGMDVSLGRPLERAFEPAVDVVENDKDVRVRMDLPGMTDKDINVSVRPEALIIQGERKVEKEEKGASYLRTERAVGSFERIIPLPVEVQAEKCEATFKSGVLEVRLPKSSAAKNQLKRIPIKAESSAEGTGPTDVGPGSRATGRSQSRR